MAGTNHNRRTLIALMVILALAAALRVAVTAEHSRNPLFNSLRIDESYYDAWASEAMEGNWFFDYVSSHSPGYPWFLAGVYTITGRGPWGFRIAQSLLGIATALIGFLLGRRLFGERSGLLAALLLGLFWPLIIFEQRTLGVQPLVLIDLLGLFLYVRSLTKPRAFSFLAAGIIAGASLLIRPTSILWVIAAFLLAAAYGLRREKRAVIGATVYLIAAAAIVSPVIVKNHSLSGEWSLIQVNGGMNFYLGNNPESDGTPYARPFGQWDRIESMPFVEAGVIGAKESDRFYLQKVIGFMRQSPGRFLLLQLHKAALLLNRAEVRATIDPEFHRRQFAALRVPWPGFGTVFGLALAGCLALSIKRRDHAAIAVFILSQGAMVSASVVASRYRMPFAAAMAILAGAGADRLASAAPALIRREWGKLSPVILAAVGLILSSLPVAPVHSDAEELYYLGQSWFLAEDDAKALESYRAALEAEPGFSQAMVGVAEIYETAGDRDREEQWSRRAVEAGPDNYFARTALARALWKKGEREEALRQMEMGVQCRPVWTPGLLSLANYYLDAGKPGAAAGRLELALKLNPTSEEARALRERIDAQRGKK